MAVRMFSNMAASEASCDVTSFRYTVSSLSTSHNMAIVDFPSFHQKFLPQFLSGLDDNQKQVLATAFKTDTDLPSFGANLERFVTDLRYYGLCNACLPGGSVKF